MEITPIQNKEIIKFVGNEVNSVFLKIKIEIMKAMDSDFPDKEIIQDSIIALVRHELRNLINQLKTHLKTKNELIK